MEIRPVKRYAMPAYATSEILEQHPELLRLVPKRWQSNQVVLTALTGLCMMMLGSRAVAADTSQNGEKKKTPPASAVAPLFIHGEGHGTFGCIAVNPPVFLSEDEARQVIVEEAKKAKIEFKVNGATLPKVEVPITNSNLPPRVPDPNAPQEAKTKEQPLELDGTEKKRNIAFEFVSEADFEAWQKKLEFVTMVQLKDVKGTAQLLREGIEKAGPKGVYGVFYDPGIGWKDFQNTKPDRWSEIRRNEDMDTRIKMINEGVRELAKEQLREQVKDFIKWLKAQGVV